MANQETFSSQQRIRSQLLESLEKKITSNEDNFEGLKTYKQNWSSFIYRIPVETRKVDERAYTPSVVSIGPLHRGSEHLKAMEEDKLSYMQYLFLHFTDAAERLERCVDAMFDNESYARTWYAELKIRVDNAESARVKFAEMMLIDGCFILELLFKNYIRSTNPTIRDPILDNYSMTAAVRHDLMRLENQIPFFVLDTLFNLTVASLLKDYEISLKGCIFLFFGGMIGLQRIPNPNPVNPIHILDLLHRCYWPSGDLNYPSATSQSKFEYSATQLDLAGVKFKAAVSEINNLFKVNFRIDHSCFHVFTSGCFEIPPFSITSSTEPFLRNLIAMEEFYFDGRFRYFTSHAFLMDKLINTAKDVDLLVQAGVIRNYLGSSEEVAHLYNNICNNVYVGGFHFNEPCNQVTDYCNLFWPRCVARLNRDYFGNPWTGLSVFAAIFIFVLSSLQTIYAILAYYGKN
ncbi:UPF0481 protein At3g47200-like [Cornus florida]|uniref:UPF0481 protein At3g47200-like n=1 Tax=Cornus florida TaxID=4283 RepID=UPI0028975527|nr:UPF0481 protein At3g47200-like [Cornus florida]